MSVEINWQARVFVASPTSATRLASREQLRFDAVRCLCGHPRNAHAQLIYGCEAGCECSEFEVAHG